MDNPILCITLPEHADKIECTAFKSPDDLHTFTNSIGTPRFTLWEKASSGVTGPVYIKQSQLFAVITQVDLKKDYFFQVDILFPKGKKEYAKLVWSKDDKCLKLLLRTPGITALPVITAAVSSQTTRSAVALFADAASGAALGIPMNVLYLGAAEPEDPKEMVFLGGDGGDQGFEYHKQVAAYLLMKEFNEELFFVQDNKTIGEIDAKINNTLNSVYNVFVALIRTQKNNTSRATYIRMLSPGASSYSCDYSFKRQDDEKYFFHWYAVDRMIDNDKDDITKKLDGIPRLYKYLDYVGKTYAGRVHELIIFSHATIRGPSHCEKNGNFDVYGSDAESDFANLPDVFKAFNTFGAIFCIAGCAKDTQIPSKVSELADRKYDEIKGLIQLFKNHDIFVKLEGIIRAAARLRSLLDKASPADTSVLDSICKIDKEHYKWQLPGDAEEIVYEDYDNNKDSFADALLLQIKKNLDKLKGLSDPTEVSLMIDVIKKQISWESLKEIVIEKAKLGQWIECAWLLKSTHVNYAAWIAALSRKMNPELTLYVLNGIPGWDGQHLKATIYAKGEDGNEKQIQGEKKYEMSHHFKKWKNVKTDNNEPGRFKAYPYALYFFNRFGVGPFNNLGYFWYIDSFMNPQGYWKGNDYEWSFDYTKVHIKMPDFWKWDLIP